MLNGGITICLLTSFCPCFLSQYFKSMSCTSSCHLCTPFALVICGRSMMVYQNIKIYSFGKIRSSTLVSERSDCSAQCSPLLCYSIYSRGIYLLLEKCKTVCYRNLFKRVYIVLEKPHLSLPDIAKAFKWLGMPMDLDEVECILANLIFRGYVRGYISHTKRVLVLSKSNPFPTAKVIAA
jgi:hypothetical protein